MAKKKGKHNALEARRRKNRRRQNAERTARLAREGMLPEGEQTAVLTAVAEPDSPGTPPPEAGAAETAGAPREDRRRFSLHRKEPKARAPWRYTPGCGT